MPRDLSEREREVAKLVATGHSTATIATKMKLQPHTVSAYRNRVYLKADVHNAFELLRWARRRGLVTDRDLA